MALERALEPALHPDPLMAAQRRPETAELERGLGHRFADRAHLDQALTHATASQGPTSAGSYQRLEFLGDRVLGLAVADILAEAFPEASEGELSRRLGELVRKETCAEVAIAWNLGAHLKLGKGAAGTGLRANRTVLADACEAVIAAVFRDAGYDAARAVVKAAFAAPLARQTVPPTNPKQMVGEWATGRGLPLPVYALLDRSGSDHAPLFRMSVTIPGLEAAAGEGPSKQVAMQEAARAFLVREGVLAEDAATGDAASGDAA
jgi:ribonuclease III